MEKEYFVSTKYTYVIFLAFVGKKYIIATMVLATLKNGKHVLTKNSITNTLKQYNLTNIITASIVAVTNAVLVLFYLFKLPLFRASNPSGTNTFEW